MCVPNVHISHGRTLQLLQDCYLLIPNGGITVDDLRGNWTTILKLLEDCAVDSKLGAAVLCYLYELLSMITASGDTMKGLCLIECHDSSGDTVTLILLISQSMSAHATSDPSSKVIQRAGLQLLDEILKVLMDAYDFPVLTSQVCKPVLYNLYKHSSSDDNICFWVFSILTKIVAQVRH